MVVSAPRRAGRKTSLTRKNWADDPRIIPTTRY